MERTILEAEQAAAALESLLNDPNFHTEHANEAKATISKLESARTEIERLYARWEELSAL
jgi:ATP-binding cassette subfamily F protein uup